MMKKTNASRKTIRFNHFITGLLLSLSIFTAHMAILHYLTGKTGKNRGIKQFHQKKTESRNPLPQDKASVSIEQMVNRYRQEIIQNNLNLDPAIWMPRVRMCLDLDSTMQHDFWTRHLDYFLRVLALKEQWMDSQTEMDVRLEALQNLKACIGPQNPINVEIRVWVIQHSNMIRKEMMEHRMKYIDNLLKS